MSEVRMLSVSICQTGMFLTPLANTLIALNWSPSA
eukprot:CAMPEP_0198246036 /NCGR_PEP_ID=MMETSP1446-20131203/44335_1 /TAXON_ID=1461542 ORGANISM="Unidentified sp, Strain CCMP2111" /NCGR_SAMPLE_ID=MMETSP1446 /ASSEMBLY_ACC=CAM_ASM_001112 /LENGTH=34 /DNA_ID= /DNA_START= /DNA_END= /DNA_ORIENTATION=